MNELNKKELEQIAAGKAESIRRPDIHEGGTIKPPDGDPEWWRPWNPTPVIDPEHGPLNK